MGLAVPLPEKPSEEAQKAEEAVDAAGQGQEKRPDKAPETGGPSGATGQLQETPPGEASKTGKAGGDGVQPLTVAYLSHAATTAPPSEEYIKMMAYEMEKSRKTDPSLSPPSSVPKKFKK
ncbi:uncharacterized protein [Triticum aestivum]|uniref:uncharacterized protein isoform X2 n=1 Tax=Triticum aestivum TaxID=4565 RepID=UPI001D007BED|nr:uncharacterized protein LOC123112455 isoform X2 [Triticum aestivum]